MKTAPARLPTTAAAFQSTHTQAAHTKVRAHSKWCSPCCTPAENLAATATRCPVVCTAWASALSTHYQNVLLQKLIATAFATDKSLLMAENQKARLPRLVRLQTKQTPAPPFRFLQTQLFLLRKVSSSLRAPSPSVCKPLRSLTVI